jgi:uncharacterized protein YjbI with pentapeptide repeats
VSKKVAEGATRSGRRPEGADDAASRQKDATDRLLAGDEFEGETFDGLALESADLGGKDLRDCTFRRCKLGESTWKQSRLEDCVFDACDLTRLAPAGLALRGVELRASKLMGIDFSRVSTLPQVAFADCDLRYAAFVGLALRKTPFLRCTIVEANFVDCDLAEATFTESMLTGTRFQGCELRAADFTGARDLFLDPQRNKLKNTIVPLEAAVLLARSYGMNVLGFGDE